MLIKKTEGSLIIFVVYVNDILWTRSDVIGIHAFMTWGVPYTLLGLSLLMKTSEEMILCGR